MMCTKDLHKAAEGDVECVRELLKRGLNPNIKDRRGWTPLHYAVKAGHYDIVWLLLDYGANPNTPAGGWLGPTPLHMAVRNQNYDMAKLLLNAGAKPDARDGWGRSPLHEAASSGNFVITHLLLENGANVNAVDANGRTPLHMAVIESSPKEPKEKRLVRRGVVALLLKYGADPNIKDKYYSRTPLHYAARDGAVEVVKAMLEHGADPTIRDSKGKTPLDLAKEAGHDEVVQILTSYTPSAASTHKKRRHRKNKLAA